MTSEQAADRLGVKPATLYAYVSRGLLRSERTAGERRSRFLRADVERLAGRQRSGGRAGQLDIVVETELTLRSFQPLGHAAQHDESALSQRQGFVKRKQRDRMLGPLEEVLSAGAKIACRLEKCSQSTGRCCVFAA